MYFLLGNSCMERSDYEGAIQSFEHAQAQNQYCISPHLWTISLVRFLLAMRYIFMTFDRFPVGILMPWPSRSKNTSLLPVMQQVVQEKEESPS